MRKTLSPRILPPRPQQLGRIKIGELGAPRAKSGGGTFRLPKKLDHFRIVLMGREGGKDDGNFLIDEAAHAKLGPKPLELDVRLYFDEVEQSFFSQMQRYEGRRLVWTCDGETGVNRKTGAEGECGRDEATGQCSCKSKPYARLAVILEANAQFGAYHVFRTTSWETISNLQSTLESFRAEFGSLRGLPMQMKLYKATDSYMDGDKEKTSTSWKVGLVLRVGYEEATAAVAEFRGRNLQSLAELAELQSATERMLLVADVEEARAIAAEFHPDPTGPAQVASQQTLDTVGSKAAALLGELSAADIERVRLLMDEASRLDQIELGEAEGIEKAIAAGDREQVLETELELKRRIALHSREAR